MTHRVTMFNNFLFVLLLAGEADIAVAHVEKLISSGIAPKDIAVIAPYNLQVRTFLHVLRVAHSLPLLQRSSLAISIEMLYHVHSTWFTKENLSRLVVIVYEHFLFESLPFTNELSINCVCNMWRYY